LETLLPALALDLGGPAPERLTGLFAGSVEGVVLEIGFGGGEHLIGEAAAHDNLGFIGCEPYINGMAKALTLVAQRGLTNIRVYSGDAAELLDWLPTGSLARIDILHPDPWPKRRHWKRRFVQDQSIATFARVLRRGGEVRFATDIADYAAWTLERFLRAAPFRWRADRADDWRQPWPGHVETRYEAKARGAGRSPVYLTFCRADLLP
jgi:tRNA (guanine-N7-)-methyltransferase